MHKNKFENENKKNEDSDSNNEKEVFLEMHSDKNWENEIMILIIKN